MATPNGEVSAFFLLRVAGQLVPDLYIVAGLGQARPVFICYLVIILCGADSMDS